MTCPVEVLSPIHIAERVVAIDAFRSRHDSDLSAECSKQIASVRQVIRP